jgi:hypothetical protein
MKNKMFLYVVFSVFQLAGLQTINAYGVVLPVEYNSVEVKPQFPGGINEFMVFVVKNYVVPEDEEGNAPTGTVEVSIVIDVDGSVNNIKILKDVGLAGAEIKRVLSKCPKWKPGRQGGEDVAVVYNFPVKVQ